MLDSSCPTKNSQYLMFIAATLSAVFLLYQFEGNSGFSLWDEGYLWYSVQRIIQGKVSIRDFMTYDPGSYYWSAEIMASLQTCLIFTTKEDAQ